MTLHDENEAVDVQHWARIFQAGHRGFARAFARVPARRRVQVMNAALAAGFVCLAEACGRVLHPRDPFTGRRSSGF